MTAKRAEPRDTTERVFRVIESDKELIQNLKKYHKREDRHAALLDLIPIARKMKVPKAVKVKRHPVKVKVPNELLELLSKRSEESGESIIALFLKAIEIYKTKAESETKDC